MRILKKSSKSKDKFPMRILKKGDKGVEVKKLQERLLELGFTTGTPDGIFGNITQSAVSAFQRSADLVVDGVAGFSTLRALDLITHAEYMAEVSILHKLKINVVSKMFPGTPLKNIEDNLPFILRALEEEELVDKPMVLMALATIRAETGNFMPISEFPSRFNTAPPGPNFNRYDRRTDLGNQGPPDGERFKGRGYIQLTGRNNYERYGHIIGLGTQLADEPDLANTPQFAAKILARFLKDKEKKIREAIMVGRLDNARRLVNGGTHGFANFEKAYKTGHQLI